VAIRTSSKSARAKKARPAKSARKTSIRKTSSRKTSTRKASTRKASAQKTSAGKAARKASTRKTSAKKAAAPATASSETRAGAPAAKLSSSGSHRARVRMYRQGLGDCFLVFLKRAGNDAPDYKILIDCGVILGTPDAAKIMTDVVRDILTETSGHVDLLIATHEHWDHLSGFLQARSLFDGLTVGNVWVAWTEDPADVLAQELGQERANALQALQLSGHALAMAGADAAAQTINDFLGFFGAAGQGTTKEALDYVKHRAPVRYCRPTDMPTDLNDPDVRLFVLGPPHDAKLIRRTLPSKKTPETYGLATGVFGAMSADISSALTNSDNDAPFNDLHAIPLDVARGMDFFRKYLWGPGEDAPPWRLISADWLDSATELALALDSATNNTSLVLAIELAGGDVLLFAADAQVGNWESWQNLKWQIGGRTVMGPDLLNRTILYKVGHHGSHNATLKEHGLEQMDNLGIAMLPVDHQMAIKKRWGNMPLPELVAALQKKTGGRVLRCDEEPSDAISGVRVEKLYFEITV
jgi:hypothetical protein